MSKLVLVLIAAVIAAWTFVDVNCHGHYGCHRIAEISREVIENRSHLYDYMKQHKDDLGRVEDGIVECNCQGGKLVLTGKVLNENIKREFSDVLGAVAGGRPIDNRIEVLNEDAIRQLQSLLRAPPTNLLMNYQIKDRGTILLTGDLPNDDIADEIGDMVARVRGVRGVKNRLGEELHPLRMLRVHNIYFDFNEWTIRKPSLSKLDEVAHLVDDYLASNPAGKVRIEGHTDSIASEQYNLWLSKKRAEAVKSELIARGIDTAKLEPVGKGESALLISPDDTPEKRAENRRIEFYFE